MNEKKDKLLKELFEINKQRHAIIDSIQAHRDPSHRAKKESELTTLNRYREKVRRALSKIENEEK